MEVRKVFVAKAISPLKKDPPRLCEQSKTIVYDTFKTKLYLFPDGRPEALEWVNEVLPTLLPLPTPREAVLPFYRSLKDQYLEFDWTTKTLYLCFLEKK